MKTIEHQLDDLAPQINQILKHSGAPGLSLGVLHKGKVIHTAHFGRRDARNPTPPDDDTIHWIGSLTKLITASAIARLVHEGKLAWDVPIREYLPAFRTRQDEFGLKATLVDLLSNRTGLSMSNTLVHFQNGEAPLAGTDTTATATYLSSTKPFGQFVYSQWNYALVENVVKEVTGISLCDYIEANIFRSLGMTRSSFDSPLDSDDNVALAHCTHDDGTATPKPDYKRTLREAGIAAGGGARTSTKGYLTFLQALLSAYNHQTSHNVDDTPDSIFTNTQAIFTPRVGFGPSQRPDLEKLAYCMGIYRTTLPAPLSFASPNFYWGLGAKHLPPYGRTLAGTEIFFHAGTSPSFLAAMYLVPSTQSAVVAFTNSPGLMDPVDFAAQLALSVILGEKPRSDLVGMAKLGREITLKNYTLLEKAIAAKKTDVPPTKPLAAYHGDYYNAIHNFVLSVVVAGDRLVVHIQRNKGSFVLSPLDGDTFHWPVTREDETCEKMMWGFLFPEWHSFKFGVGGSGQVDRVEWKHDPLVADAEVFRRTQRDGKLTKL
jgi:CubicO group peptidase (beta-lactamase class C family)